MPTLSDTQPGGTVTVTGGNVAASKSWVTILPGPPVKIHGVPKVSGNLWVECDVFFAGGALDASLQPLAGSTRPPYYMALDTAGITGEWTLWGYLYPFVDVGDHFRVDIIQQLSGTGEVTSMEWFAFNAQSGDSISFYFRTKNAAGTAIWPKVNEGIRIQVYDIT